MAKDTLHNNVREALIKDGWTITDDPLTLLVVYLLIWGQKKSYWQNKAPLK